MSSKTTRGRKPLEPVEDLFEERTVILSRNPVPEVSHLMRESTEVDPLDDDILDLTDDDLESVSDQSIDDIILTEEELIATGGFRLGSPRPLPESFKNRNKVPGAPARKKAPAPTGGKATSKAAGKTKPTPRSSGRSTDWKPGGAGKAASNKQAVSGQRSASSKPASPSTKQVAKSAPRSSAPADPASKKPASKQAVSKKPASKPTVTKVGRGTTNKAHDEDLTEVGGVRIDPEVDATDQVVSFGKDSWANRTQQLLERWLPELRDMELMRAHQVNVRDGQKKLWDTHAKRFSKKQDFNRAVAAVAVRDALERVPKDNLVAVELRVGKRFYLVWLDIGASRLVAVLSDLKVS